MAEVTGVRAQIAIRVRYFAAARAAAGAEEEVVHLSAGSTLADLVATLSGRGLELDRVLQRCSYLCDSFAVRDPQTVIESGQTVDVLPPFAGG
ncbi:MoaD/ThiS family protein [Mycolicibacterium mengxianglii]|uniref:MoaD/ThiS family protein n=1 Tax=Mycolicibacterium mengxianglii TaxID=2736649 RepID=UPI001E42B6D7|nr:MoaD/ThiS family protein [Mycolicibacterium mengxianglii]